MLHIIPGKMLYELIHDLVNAIVYYQPLLEDREASETRIAPLFLQFNKLLYGAPTFEKVFHITFKESVLTRLRPVSG